MKVRTAAPVDIGAARPAGRTMALRLPQRPPSFISRGADDRLGERRRDRGGRQVSAVGFGHRVEIEQLEHHLLLQTFQMYHECNKFVVQ